MKKQDLIELIKQNKNARKTNPTYTVITLVQNMNRN